MAWAMPQAGQGLGVSEPQGARFPAIGVHQVDAQKAMQSIMNFADRLLSIECFIDVFQRQQQILDLFYVQSAGVVRSIVIQR